MKQTYRVLAGLVALGVLVQAGSIAAGWFTTIHDVDNGLVVDKNYSGNAFHGIHGFVGFNLMPLLGLVLLVVSFFAAAFSYSLMSFLWSATMSRANILSNSAPDIFAILS